MPRLDRKLGSGGVPRLPGRVDDGPRGDRVSNIVGAVSERGGTSGENLDEGVRVLDLVRVFLGIAVHPVHAVTLGGSGDTRLSRVNVVVETVQETGDDHGREALGQGLDVVNFVDRAGAHRVLVQRAHRPTEEAFVLAHLGVELGLRLLDELAVREFELGKGRLLRKAGDLGVAVYLLLPLGLAGRRSGGGRGRRLELRVMLDDRVIGDDNAVRVDRRRSRPKKGTLDKLPPLQSVVPLDHLAVDVRNEENR